MTRIATLLLAAALAVCTYSAALAQKRVALVIGNSSYNLIPSLSNPKNDADLMARTLKKVGFEVVKAVDVDNRGMARAMRTFGKRLRAAGSNAVGLFFYAGHGVRANGENYLIPLGAQIESEGDLPLEAIGASQLLGQMEQAGNSLNLVIFDACRNNPFQRGFRSVSRGLTRVQAPSGSLVAFSAAPGQVAADGVGDNSPYTAALAKWMLEPGLPVEQVFKRVRVSVEDSTGKAQTPWEESSLRGDFFFVPEKGLSAGMGIASPPSKATVELTLWNSVKEANDPAALKEFLRQHPHGPFSKLARLRLKKIISSLKEAALPSPPQQQLTSTPQQQLINRPANETIGRLLDAEQAKLQSHPEYRSSLLLKIKDRGYLKVGSIWNQRPIYWKPKDYKSKPSGFAVDVVQQFANDIGVELKFVYVDYENIELTTSWKRYDILIYDINAWGHEKLLDFTDPYFVRKTIPVTKSDQAWKYSGWESMNSPKVKVAAEKWYWTNYIRNYFLPKSTPLLTEDPVHLEVISGKADIFISDNIELANLRKKHPSLVAVPTPSPLRVAIPTPRRPEKTPIGLSVVKGDSVWLSYLNTWIALQKKRGFFERTQSRWGL